MIPSLGRTVYIIYEGGISKDTVVMKGKDSFAVNDTFNDTIIEACRQPIYFEDYGTYWFTSLSAAKKVLKLRCGTGDRIVQKTNSYWTIEGRYD